MQGRTKCGPQEINYFEIKHFWILLNKMFQSLKLTRVYIESFEKKLKSQEGNAIQFK